MKHVIQIETEWRVLRGDVRGPQTDPQEPVMNMEEVMAAIGQRANYVSPVLEHLLHLDHDTRPGVVRE